MTNNEAVGQLTNNNNALNAVIAHVVNGGPYVAPGLIADPTDDPNPEVSKSITSQLKTLQSQVSTLAKYAANN